jgi:hypothetical protein
VFVRAQEHSGETRGIVHGLNQTGRPEPVGECSLVIVDRLAVTMEARNDDRSLPTTQDRQNGADPGVRNDRTRLADIAEEVVEGQ